MALVALAALAIAALGVEIAAWALISSGQSAAPPPGALPALAVPGIGPDGARRPHTEVRHRTPCHDVTYAASAAGVRDAERTRHADGPRVVVLGSDLVEGVGVERDARLAAQLERATGREHLVFALAGASPYSQLVRYREAARLHAHDAVLIGVAPGLDLPRLDAREARRRGVRGVYPELDGGSLVRRDVDPGALRDALRARSWSFNLLEHLADRGPPAQGRPDADAGGREHSAFYDAVPARVALLERALAELVEAAGERPVAVVLMPVLVDLLRHQESGSSPLASRLRERLPADGVRIVDLLAPMATARDPQALFHATCGAPWWSARGNEVAFHYLRPALADGFYRD